MIIGQAPVCRAGREKRPGASGFHLAFALGDVRHRAALLQAECRAELVGGAAELADCRHLAARLVTQIGQGGSRDVLGGCFIDLWAVLALSRIPK
jgi:hypothetical protein